MVSRSLRRKPPNDNDDNKIYDIERLEERVVIEHIEHPDGRIEKRETKENMVSRMRKRPKLLSKTEAAIVIFVIVLMTLLGTTIVNGNWNSLQETLSDLLLLLLRAYVKA